MKMPGGLRTKTPPVTGPGLDAAVGAWLTVLLLAAAAPPVNGAEQPGSSGPGTAPGPAVEPLPAPDRTGTHPLETLLQSRESLREFSDESLSRSVLGQLLWAAGGTTLENRFMHRTVPSAGALYPIELYLVTAEGLARYDPAAHALVWLKDVDARADLSAAALGQVWVAQAPAVIVIAAEPQRTRVKYGERADRYVMMESGCACQNLLLQAVALGLGAVPVGAFDDDQVAQVLGLPASQRALLIVPVGSARER
jgi:SagB-type dehydrogenase family enzyme